MEQLQGGGVEERVLYPELAGEGDDLEQMQGGGVLHLDNLLLGREKFWNNCSVGELRKGCSTLTLLGREMSWNSCKVIMLRGACCVQLEGLERCFVLFHARE